MKLTRATRGVYNPALLSESRKFYLEAWSLGHRTAVDSVRGSKGHSLETVL